MNSPQQQEDNSAAFLQMNSQTTPFDSAHDDFLEQMLSTLGNPSSAWPVDDDTTPSNDNANNVVFSYDDSSNLASKFRSHQITAGAAAASKSSPTASAAAAAAMMLQHQLMMSRSHNDVNVSSFKSPNNHQGGDDGGSSVQAAMFNGFTGSLSPKQPQHFHHPQGGALQAQSYGGQQAQTMTSQPPAGGSTGATAAGQARPRVRARRGQATDPHSIAERVGHRLRL